MQKPAPAFPFALVLVFVLGGLLDAAPVRAGGTKVITVRAEPKAGRAKATTRGGPYDQTALWWNDPGIVKALSLTDEQRNKMEKYLKAYREKVPADRRPDAFHEALVQGDWEKARSESERITKVAEQSVRMRGTLKIEVLSLLSDEQRQILVDRFPQLIYKPWRRAMREAQSR